jgi:hypothetical protein
MVSHKAERASFGTHGYLGDDDNRSIGRWQREIRGVGEPKGIDLRVLNLLQ